MSHARERTRPRRRWARALIVAALAVGYLALMWYVVFPWLDRTFINRPAL